MDKNALYFFDTNVLLALIRGKQLGEYLNQTFALSEVLNRPLISVVSHGELWAMAKRNGWAEKKSQALQNMLNDLVTLDLNDPSIIEGYVAVDQQCLSHPKGARNISDNDKWIAASAAAASAVLLTTDQDFIHLHPDVCRVHYVDPTSKLPAKEHGEQQELS